MQEYRAAAAGDARRAVVVDLDNKIVEMVVTLEPVAAAIAIQPYRLVVVSARRVFAPGVLGPDGPNRQECPRPRMTVGAPPQLPWPKRASWGPAVAFALPVNGIGGLGASQAAWVFALSRAGVTWNDAVISAFALYAVAWLASTRVSSRAATDGEGSRASQDGWDPSLRSG